MGGIVFLAGPQANARIAECLERIRHRGPDAQSVWANDAVAMAFATLATGGPCPAGRQPCEHGDLVGAIDGQIHNHRVLAAVYGVEEGAHVFLRLVEHIGHRANDELDGFYAGIVFRRSTGELLCFRDPVGQKPLFVGRSRSEVFIVSELKVFDDVDWFEALPLGVSAVDVKTGEVRRLAPPPVAVPRDDLVTAIGEAVRKRLPSAEQPVAVFLSGGLDSSIIATHVAQHRPDATYFTLGHADSPDRRAVESLVRSLGLRDVRAVALPTEERLPERVSLTVYATESFNPSIVSNGLATYLLAEAASSEGIRIALTGEGADELFGGYHQFGPNDPWRDTRAKLVNDLPFTELRRLDQACMANAVEARCPFLDASVRAHAEALNYDDLYGRETNKVALRRAYKDVLPREIVQRSKTSFDVGSGIRAQVVSFLHRNGRRERDELRDIWREHFSLDADNPYFHAYPAFDAAIDARGAAHR